MIGPGGRATKSPSIISRYGATAEWDRCMHLRSGYAASAPLPQPISPLISGNAPFPALTTPGALLEV